MLEALAAGTTTALDHAHVIVSPAHAKLAVAGTVSSGIRSVFCYMPTAIASFNPMTFQPNPLQDWVMQTFSELADHGPFGDGRVTMGFAWDLWFLGPEAVKSVFATVKEKGVRTVTTHGVSLYNITKILKDHDLLDERVVISHGGLVSKEDAEMIKESGAFISSTPSTELQMAMGRPLCFDASFQGDAPEANRVGYVSPIQSI